MIILFFFFYTNSVKTKTFPTIVGWNFYKMSKLLCELRKNKEYLHYLPIPPLILNHDGKEISDKADNLADEFHHGYIIDKQKRADFDEVYDKNVGLWISQQGWPAAFFKCNA